MTPRQKREFPFRPTQEMTEAEKVAALKLELADIERADIDRRAAEIRKALAHMVSA